MDEELGDFDHDETTEIAEFKSAHFSSELRLPAGEEQQLKNAAAAVRQEFRDSSRGKRLNCKKVSVFAERNRGTWYVVHIGKIVEFVWTCEGAKAFCSSSLDDPDQKQEKPSFSHISRGSRTTAQGQNICCWSCKLVQLDTSGLTNLKSSISTLLSDGNRRQMR